MQICITLYILFDTVEAHTCTHLKIVYSWHIHIQHILATFHGWRWLRSKIMAILVQHVCQKSELSGQTLKNWICYKIQSSDSFSLQFWHNTHNNDTKMLTKWNFKKLEILTPQEEIPIFPHFPYFRTKIPDWDFMLYFKIIYFLKALYHSFLYYRPKSWS